MANLTYFRRFDAKSDYDDYIKNDPILPNVSIVNNSDIYFKDGERPTPPPPHDYSQDYLTIVLIEGGNFYCYSDEIFYSIDNGVTWTSGNGLTNLPVGQKILLKSNKFGGAGSTGPFSTSDIFNVEGNIMSLYDPDGFRTRTGFDENNYAGFKNLFSRNSYLISAENLILPATTLAEGCYEDMFAECASLTTAPSLPATTLAKDCYGYMFWGCTSLNYIKCLATNISADSCTDYWVGGVAATGTFVKSPDMNDWATGISGIPDGWDVQDA